MIWLQSIIIRLDRTPLRRVFERLYALGLRRLLAALAEHRAVFCVLGCGSYFEGTCVPGLSDIDLIIVLRDGVTRSDAAPREIAHSYERVRRLFPFLGRWHEKEGTLLFLTDVRAGFPLPESFRVRLKQGRLVPLYGEALPHDLVSGRVTASEAVTELDTLLRIALIADPRHTRRLVFWKRLFAKLIAVATMVDLSELATEMRSLPELAFLADDDTRLFFRSARHDPLFGLLLDLTRRICEALRVREPSVRIEVVLFRPGGPAAEPAPRSNAIARLERSGQVSVTTLPSMPIGLSARLLYFSIDQRIPLLELHGSAYQSLQRLCQVLHEYGDVDENLLVLADGFLFVATRQPGFVDLVPLDPLQFANVYTALRDGATEFEMPASVLAEQEAMAAGTFRGLAHLYRLHDGWVTKLSYPCIYREDDSEVIESALRITRASLLHGKDRLLIQHSDDLIDYLRQRHPECADFLTALQHYRRHYWDAAAPVPNNVYRCLHQFLWQLLSGTAEIALDALHKHLGITVGVITRNRAADLAAMLESLTRQVRLPDEVLVVDNGSIDDTQAVLQRFGDRLPIRSRFLAEAGIPRARNLVIEEAAHEIISFIDDDCISEPGWLAAVERGFLRADNVGIVGGWVRHEPAARPSSVDNYYQVFHHTKS